MKLLILFLIFIAYFSYRNTRDLKIINIKYTTDKIKVPLTFLVLSDYHDNRRLNTEKLSAILDNMSFDGIFLLGDISDRRGKLEVTENFLRLFKNQTDKFYIYGNHEKDRGVEKILDTIYQEYGFQKAGSDPIEVRPHSGEIYTLYGKDFYDPGVVYQTEGHPTFLITHSYTEFAKKRADSLNFDGIFTGHTHGGQVRLPLIGQIIGHGPELFPKYSKGCYISPREEFIYITSGTGNSTLPIRLNNPAEGVIIRILPK